MGAPLTIKDFEAYLDIVPDTFKFDRASNSSCPIAGFMRAKYPAAYAVSVDEEWVEVRKSKDYWDDRNKSWEMPSWASRFVRLVDKREGRITAKTARKLLGQARA